MTLPNGQTINIRKCDGRRRASASQRPLRHEPRRANMAHNLLRHAARHSSLPPAPPASSTRCRRSKRRASARSRGCRCRSASCSKACCATATARRSPRSTCASSPTGRRPARAPTRFRSSSRASCCRTSPACRCSPTSPRCATSPRDMGKNPKMIEPLVPVDLVVDHSVMIDYYGTPGRARPQHEARVPAQRRALPVHEVGHAGVRHVQGRAAGHRHRAPGQPRVPRARRAQRRTASTTPTRSSAPTATRR